MPSTEKQQTGQIAHYRLVVRSAVEAVSLVRERFGTGAKVLSVRQLESGGLTRFLQKPRLEVIVEVGTEQIEAGPLPTVGDCSETISSTEELRKADLNTPSAIPKTETLARTKVEGGAGRAMELLRAAGIDDTLLERVRSDHTECNWGEATAPEALSRLVAWLRSQFDAAVNRPAGGRRVFIGSCGAGKTTALCKTLAAEVFVRGGSPAVLKLDGEHPNATDGLAAFCDVLNVPLLRSATEVEEFDEDTKLFVDMPGVGFDARLEHARLAQTLDALRIDTRVLVVNATWEVEVIADAYAMGRTCGATHVIFSHLDEVRRPGKLWRFALFGGLTPLAGSFGPSPAGEMQEDVFSALLSSSFPATVARAAGIEGGAS